MKPPSRLNTFISRYGELSFAALSVAGVLLAIADALLV